MYPSVRSRPHNPATPDEEVARRKGVFSQNLVALGLTSFFTDISSEMVHAVAPVFLTAALGFSILGVAGFEAGREAIRAAAQVWGASHADRSQRHKRTAAAGYGISTATRFGLVASVLVSFIPSVPFLLADRVGKGIRTAPRDALISLSTPPGRFATAFGIHRAMDTAGALLGPLVAFFVLREAPNAFDAVFVISAIAGVLGLSVIVMFAQEKPQREAAVATPKVWHQWRAVAATPGMVGLAVSAALLAVFTVGESLAYLVILRTSEMNVAYFPLLFVGSAVIYIALAVPIGRLADRVGKRPIFLAGHVALLVAYLTLGWSELTTGAIIACLVMIGLWNAATDGVIAALTASIVSREIRASGIAGISVVMAIAKIISALLFGWIWHTWGKEPALAIYTVALALAVVAGIRLIGSDTSTESRPAP